MKFKTTAKALVNGTAPRYLKCCGYCEMESLLYYHSEIAYNSGVYGWNFDVYQVYGLTITTGYRNMCGERLQGVREYNEKARNILYNHNTTLSWDEKKYLVENLLKEFCLLNGGYDENGNL